MRPRDNRASFQNDSLSMITLSSVPIRLHKPDHGLKYPWTVYRKGRPSNHRPKRHNKCSCNRQSEEVTISCTAPSSSLLYGPRLQTGDSIYMTSDNDSSDYERRLKQSQKLSRQGEFRGTRLVSRYLGMIFGLGAIVLLVFTVTGEPNNVTGNSTVGGVVLSLLMGGIAYYLFKRR